MRGQNDPGNRSLKPGRTNNHHSTDSPETRGVFTLGTAQKHLVFDVLRRIDLPAEMSTLVDLSAKMSIELNVTVTIELWHEHWQESGIAYGAPFTAAEFRSIFASHSA